MKVVLDKGAKMPTRAHDTDAGLDLYSRECKVIYSKSNATFDTGVHIEIPKGYVGFLKSKSGLNVKHNLTSDGVIDSGFTGSMVVKLYNHGNEDYTINVGDKISQLVILPVCLEDVELTNNLEETERGSNGFGSTGK